MIVLWQQKLDELSAYIRQLEQDLADVDRLVSAHQHLIDASPRETWPRNSILGKAVDRHIRRHVLETDEERRRQR